MKMNVWTTVGIKKTRRNGLVLITHIENRRHPGNTLDNILARAGVPELTDEELAERLAEIEVQRQQEKSKSLEALIK